MGPLTFTAMARQHSPQWPLEGLPERWRGMQPSPGFTDLAQQSQCTKKQMQHFDLFISLRVCKTVNLWGKKVSKLVAETRIIQV